MKIFLEAARSLVYRIAWCKDQGRPLNHLEAAVAKLFVADWSLGPTNDACCYSEATATATNMTSSGFPGRPPCADRRRHIRRPKGDHFPADVRVELRELRLDREK